MIKDRQMSIWYAYMVRCNDGSLYTGISTDVTNRVHQHNTAKGAKYVKRPAVLVYAELCGTHSAALKRELAIKRLSRLDKLLLVKIDDFNTVVRESTCQKRITVCEIYDIYGQIISRESNRCSPTDGKCTRLDVVQDKTNYDVTSNCNWEHAEIGAVNNLLPGTKPYSAILYGHDFYCDACEKALRAIGVEVFEIKKLLIEY